MSMKRLRSLPGAALAVGAFVLTVLLGAGGAPALAWWDQNGSVSMTVTASNTWTGPTVTLGCAADGTNAKKVNVTYTLSSATQSLKVVAKKADGSTGPTNTELAKPGATGSITIGGDDDFVTANRVGSVLTLRVIATFANQPQVTADIVLSLGGSNGKISCP
ncbi:hypothetical protein [Pseudarthrobacter sp. MEB009]|uniref:hypothetical protein n=1 Tax=Pseudarthrobacter sp. MEB009 TaxID=3040326 RepID=UPI0025561E73|nr:hypothetical protein [Pseudarthrobacter sp. MEB009]